MTMPAYAKEKINGTTIIIIIIITYNCADHSMFNIIIFV